MVSLKKATLQDSALAIAFGRAIDKEAHAQSRQEEKITKAVSDGDCFLIFNDNTAVGIAIFDYRFFDQGWIELIVIDDEKRGEGIGPQAMDRISSQCTTDKLFTSTNSSNFRMQKALAKAGFSISGIVHGLDDGDPELFYCKTNSIENP